MPHGNQSTGFSPDVRRGRRGSDAASDAEQTSGTAKRQSRSVGYFRRRKRAAVITDISEPTGPREDAGIRLCSRSIETTWPTIIPDPDRSFGFDAVDQT